MFEGKISLNYFLAVVIAFLAAVMVWRQLDPQEQFVVGCAIRFVFGFGSVVAFAWFTSKAEGFKTAPDVGTLAVLAVFIGLLAALWPVREAISHFDFVRWMNS